jgi:cytochrome b involved in lipid metabolism
MKIAKAAVGSSFVIFAAAVIVLFVLGNGEESLSGGEPQSPKAEESSVREPSTLQTPAEAPAPKAEPRGAAPMQNGQPQFTVGEVAEHNHMDDCWLIIRGRVYDVTRYIPRHPAPLRTITDYCGKESTAAFETKEDLNRPHRSAGWRLLERYRVGDLAE